MQIVEQNGGGKLRRLKKIIKKIAFRRDPKISSGNVIIIMLSLLLLSFRKEIIRKDTAFLFETKS